MPSSKSNSAEADELLDFILNVYVTESIVNPLSSFNFSFNCSSFASFCFCVVMFVFRLANASFCSVIASDISLIVVCWVVNEFSNSFKFLEFSVKALVFLFIKELVLVLSANSVCKVFAVFKSSSVKVSLLVSSAFFVNLFISFNCSSIFSANSFLKSLHFVIVFSSSSCCSCWTSKLPFWVAISFLIGWSVLLKASFLSFAWISFLMPVSISSCVFSAVLRVDLVSFKALSIPLYVVSPSILSGSSLFNVAFKSSNCVFKLFCISSTFFLIVSLSCFLAYTSQADFNCSFRLFVDVIPSPYVISSSIAVFALFFAIILNL